MRIVVVVAVVALSVTPDLYAQAAATSLAGPASRMKTGQTVVVTLESGEVIKGEVATVSDASLVLKEPMRTLSATDVQRVTASRTFARRGALIGGAAGFALGAGAVIAMGECSENHVILCNDAGAGGVIAGGGLLGLVGAGVGALFGALVHGERVVYERTQSRTTQTVVEPLVARGHTGVRMQIQW